MKPKTNGELTRENILLTQQVKSLLKNPPIGKEIYLKTIIQNTEKNLEKATEEITQLKKDNKNLEELWREQRNAVNALAYIILKNQ